MKVPKNRTLTRANADTADAPGEEQNKEAEMVTYFGEFHWLASPANWTDAWKRIEAFFDRYLKAPALAQ
jgi:hypothetical protein